MAEEPIKNDQIIEPNWANDAIQSSSKLLEEINLLITAFKQLLTLTGKKIPLTDPKTLTDAEQLAIALKKITQLENGLTDAQKAQIQAQQTLNKQKADYRSELKGQISAYQELQNQYSQAAQKARDLAAAQGLNNQQTKEATKEANALNNKLKQIDASIGNHQREVGNYGKTVGILGKGVAGLTGLFAGLGSALGINTEILQTAHETSKELIKTMRELHHAEQLEKIAHVENTVAIEGETVAQEELAVAEGVSTGGITLLIAGIVAATVAIIAYVFNTKQMELAEEERSRAIDGTIIKNENLRKSYNENIQTIKDLSDQYDVLNGKMKKVDADANKADRERAAKVQEIRNKEKADIIELNTPGQIAKRIGMAVLQGTIPSQILSKQVAKIHKDANDEAEAVQQHFWTELKKINFEGAEENKKEAEKAAKEAEKENAVHLEKMTKIYSEGEKDRSDEINKETKEHFDDQLKLTAEWIAHDKLMRDLADEDDKKRLAERKKRIDDEMKMIEQINEGIREGLKKRSEFQQEADQRDIDSRQRALEIQTKLAAEGKANVLGETEAQIAKAEEKKLQDAKKAAKQQEALALIEVFEKALQTGLKDDKKSFPQAFGEALAAEGLVSAAFSKLFAGFYEGTDSLGQGDGLKIGSGKDNILIRAHEGERILGVNDSAQIPDGMTNKEVVAASLAYSNADLQPMFFPKIYEINEVNSSLKIAEIIGREVNKAMENAIDKMPVHTNNLDKLGEWTEKTKENSINVIIHHKKSLHRPSLRING